MAKKQFMEILLLPQKTSCSALDARAVAVALRVCWCCPSLSPHFMAFRVISTPTRRECVFVKIGLLCSNHVLFYRWMIYRFIFVLIHHLTINCITFHMHIHCSYLLFTMITFLFTSTSFLDLSASAPALFVAARSLPLALYLRRRECWWLWDLLFLLLHLKESISACLLLW